MLGISQNALLDLVHTGKLAATEHDRSLRFARTAVEAYRRGRTTER
jgi:hypothetical protein